MGKKVKSDGRVMAGEPLARYTTWGVGGAADLLYTPDTLEELAHYLQGVPDDMPISWIGKGSNLLVRDGGVRGLVIVLSKGVDRIGFTEEGLIRAEAGVSLSRLSSFSRRGGDGCMDFLAGIPGSVGGALAMNAGAFGAEIWDYVTGVEVINRRGEIRERPVKDYRIGYRSVTRLKDETADGEEWFVAALMDGRNAEHDGPEETTSKAEHSVDGTAMLRNQLTERNRSQPMALKSCGSVFKNPPGDFAGRLIEGSGLKGLSVGAATVSEQHANFIVHGGDATAAEIESLIEQIHEVVKERQGVSLQREVRIIGEPLDKKQGVIA